MPIVPFGSVNLSASNVPNVLVQIVPPNPILVGTPTNIILVVGTASWGPVNSPFTIGSMQQQVAIFGNPQPVKYDMGTVVYAASQQGAANFRCIRVTDGTDAAAVIALLDNTDDHIIGANLTSIYTGSLGNSINAVIGIGSSYTSSAPTYSITLYIAGGIPEVFDNISTTNGNFWQNLVNAINLGQSPFRGPSQLVIASTGTSIGAVNITQGGSYQTLPTLGATIGTGATIQPVMSSTSATSLNTDSGYTEGDVLTLVGGTSTDHSTITVDTVTSGVISAFHINHNGQYEALPSDPVSVTGGTGTGATFNVLWKIEDANILNGGSGYTSSSALTITGGGGTGGGAGTLVIGSSNPPAQDSYQLTGGVDGNSGVTTSTLIGNDASSPRTGMYAGRGTGASIGVLADADDSTHWTDQVSYGASEATYMIGVMAAGYQDNISGAQTLIQNSGVNNYNLSVMMGDWNLINDPFNNQTRFISPQGFKTGELAAISPNGSSLNKILNGIVATQKTAEGRVYSQAELSQIKSSRIELITQPIPAGNSFGCRFGINTSSNPLTNTDNYTRMINFLATSLDSQLGVFIGQPITPDLISDINAAISTFLQNLADDSQPGGAMIGTADGSGQPFRIIIDSSQSALGILIINVYVQIFPILQLLVVNLQGNETPQIQVAPPELRQLVA